MSKSVSILGCGWLGLPLAKKLVSLDYSVKGSSTSAEKLNSLKASGISPFLISISEDEVEGEIKQFLESEILIINIPPKRKSPGAYVHQIQQLIPHIAASTIKNVLFISSTSVYPDTNTLVDENCVLPPEKASGKVLLEVEKIFQSNKHFQTTVLRFAGLIGPDRNPGRFLAGREIKVHPEAVVNLIYLQDCIGLIKTLLEKNIWGEVFNGCSTLHPSKAEFYTKAAILGQFNPPDFIPDPDQKFKIISNQKILSATDYSFVFPDPLASL
ncbi:SDR family oxidoreductase [Flexithrix dorotheae]|uniref:SDR family oxidoreductase n=1 Tax=Flexithrix dorotheae TaxID=70993 RepID=UPI00036DEA40|nr:SDR family oxidoreductase [Flexithrix dorotheae]